MLSKVIPFKEVINVCCVILPWIRRRSIAESEVSVRLRGYKFDNAFSLRFCGDSRIAPRYIAEKRLIFSTWAEAFRYSICSYQ